MKNRELRAYWPPRKSKSTLHKTPIMGIPYSPQNANSVQKLSLNPTMREQNSYERPCTGRPSSSSTFSLKVRRTWHDGNTLIKHPVANTQVLCNCIPNFLIFDLIRFKSIVNIVVGQRLLQAGRSLNSSEQGGDKNSIDTNMNNTAKDLER